MLKIEKFELGPIGTNAYLLSTEDGSRGVIIDPGMNPNSLVKRINGMQIEAILLTHAHFDHMGGVDEVRKLKGCPVYLHDAEADWLTDPKKNGSARWPDIGAQESFPAEYALDGGMTLDLLGEKLHVFYTPGHSPGSVSFLYADKHLFSGDVLFKMSVGRTDLPGGNERQLLDSIHGTLFDLDDAVQVYPGHGGKTTIGFERANNPYI